jgi:hypothetical protein
LGQILTILTALEQQTQRLLAIINFFTSLSPSLPYIFYHFVLGDKLAKKYGELEIMIGNECYE